MVALELEVDRYQFGWLIGADRFYILSVLAEFCSDSYLITFSSIFSDPDLLI